MFDYLVVWLMERCLKASLADGVNFGTNEHIHQKHNTSLTFWEWGEKVLGSQKTINVAEDKTCGPKSMCCLIKYEYRNSMFYLRNKPYIIKISITIHHINRFITIQPINK
jgi:hypothetical protein